jgi:hypothetical protein
VGGGCPLGRPPLLLVYQHTPGKFANTLKM